MKYSFIIPVFNCKTYLSACVESILAADVDDCEIILVDDGSTDGSGAVCDELAEKYSRVRVFHKKNGGVSAARNTGMEAARGEYLIFVDGDDTLDSRKLKAMTDSFCESTADLAIFGIAFDFYKNGICYRSDELYPPHNGILTANQWQMGFSELYGANAVSSSCTKIFRQSILTEHEIRFSEAMFLYEDLEFVLRYLAHCGRIFNVPQAIYRYRQSEDEGNAKRRLARIDCLSDFLAPIEAAVNGLPGVPAEQKEAVLVELYQVLARGKISGAGLKQIAGICGDYAQWYHSRGYAAGASGFHRDLCGGKALRLMMQDRKTALRHRIAVWAKAHHLYKRK